MEKVKGETLRGLLPGRELIRTLIRTMKDDEVQFRLVTASIITLIPLFTFLFMFALLFLFLRLNVGFFATFESMDVAGLGELFFEYTLKNALDFLPLLLGLIIVQFMVGLYISRLLLRPFVAIGNYCQKAMEGKDVSYDPDFFTDLKLLTRFAEYFFNWMENASKKGELYSVKIPKKFTKIHKPVFEKDFFIHYSFFILSSALIFAGVNYSIIMSVKDNVISFAQETLPLNSSISEFLLSQSALLQDILLGVMFVHILLNFVLATYLYSKVSGPAFGIFATMRSFIKGNTKSRVHLIGYYYVRKQCRIFNKYLDFIERKYVK